MYLNPRIDSGNPMEADMFSGLSTGFGRGHIEFRCTLLHNSTCLYTTLLSVCTCSFFSLLESPNRLRTGPSRATTLVEELVEILATGRRPKRPSMATAAPLHSCRSRSDLPNRSFPIRVATFPFRGVPPQYDCSSGTEGTTGRKPSSRRQPADLQFLTG